MRKFISLTIYSTKFIPLQEIGIDFLVFNTNERPIDSMQNWIEGKERKFRFL